mmetsp:Transcript_19693/g.28056  ORF Transcript_19693/g.28056 Transcript_19693/m.28056 type:complete len:331 (+) Transcript_19693:213-1205(+)|eukprot:CAMPEP_0201685494 /NCGR_PEP_ID=MMETSP0578-20130828/230_1 /ASSEMBLY_ACC=CAM_ASM_000663 /TAXON_ID=267565 /ORGANISM="Skeletonema grethea, Strain CCMP 1804" /LENGTH=330 /DNA_ID=CAMNT_0048169395 /DNA_START=151 /DNA_END=1143 /DNA_ORIENTATION=+
MINKYSLCIIRAYIGCLVSTTNHITAALSTPSHKIRTHHALTAPLQAKIYYPDDFDVSEDAEAYLEQAAELFNEVPHSELADRLFSEPDKASVLARLASAHSPAEYSIELPNINNVRCSYVDTKHLEIEAVVCDNYECSTLLVPVEFPKECDLDCGMEECILKNVENLDDHSDNLIQARLNYFADEEEAKKAYDVFKLIGGTDYLKSSPTKLPEWWVPPTSSEDVSECDMIEKLLNEPDWQLEMRGLSKQVLNESVNDGDEIKLALVKAVGPAGMVLEAQVWRGGKSVYDDGGINNINILDVHVKFASENSSGSASIKDRVLRVFSSVDV